MTGIWQCHCGDRLLGRITCDCGQDIDLNMAKPQRGFGKHPGPPPHRYNGKQIYSHWYRNYMDSEDWMTRRHLILRRCSQICEGCGVKPATQIHHQTYDHVGFEFLFQLVGLCRDCHARLHNK